MALLGFVVVFSMFLVIAGREAANSQHFIDVSFTLLCPCPSPSTRTMHVKASGRKIRFEDEEDNGAK